MDLIEEILDIQKNNEYKTHIKHLLTNRYGCM